MISLFKKQIEFEYWSNTQILQTLHLLKETDERALLLFSHLLSSHCMWLSRVKKEDMTCTLFQERTLAECEQLMKENRDGWLHFLEDKRDLDLATSIEFMGLWEHPPQQRRMRIDDAIIHLINHSSYHRGQIIASIKGKVEPLPLTTYIMFASEIV